jgi:6-phosphogluconate dehydrogenase
MVKEISIDDAIKELKEFKLRFDIMIDGDAPLYRAICRASDALVALRKEQKEIEKYLGL